MSQEPSPIPVNPDIELKIVRATLLSRPADDADDAEEDQTEDRTHILAFSLSIRNNGAEPVRLTGKKWVIEHAGHTFNVFESSHLFNTRPLLLPEQIFAYNGYHHVHPPASLHLTLLGKDDNSSLFRSKTLVIHPPGKKKSDSEWLL